MFPLPDDVVDERWLFAQFPDPTIDLSAMVLAVCGDLIKNITARGFGRGRAGSFLKHV